MIRRVEPRFKDSLGYCYFITEALDIECLEATGLDSPKIDFLSRYLASDFVPTAMLNDRLDYIQVKEV
jgi:hypothetical protein